MNQEQQQLLAVRLQKKWAIEDAINKVVSAKTTVMSLHLSHKFGRVDGDIISSIVEGHNDSIDSLKFMLPNEKG